MDQQGSSVDTSSVLERLKHLETSQKYERLLTERDMSALHQRLLSVEQRPTLPIQPAQHGPTSTPSFDTSPAAKILLAILLPLFVLLTTGSVEHAVKALRLVGMP